MNLTEAKRRVDDAFRTLLGGPERRQLLPPLPESITAGKLYEAFILTKVVERLVEDERFDPRLVNANYLPLKTSPGPVNRGYPHIELRREGAVRAEMWTDVEFVSLSYSRNGAGREPTRGEYHELDILVIAPKVHGYPRHDQIWLGVECKNTGYRKGMLREILGVRRELSLLADLRPTSFRRWPRPRVPANPPSCLMVFSTDQRVSEFSAPGDTFGIEFRYQELSP